RAAVHFTNGVAQIKDNLWWNFATNGVPVPLAETTTADSSGYGAVLFSDASLSNQVVNPLLRNISRTNDPLFGLDPRPQPGSPALTSSCAAPNEGFYAPVSYNGALQDGNWPSDWTLAAELGYISGEAAGTPAPVVGPGGPPVITSQPMNVTASAGGSVTLSVVATGSGLRYQWFHNGDLIQGE